MRTRRVGLLANVAIWLAALAAVKGVAWTLAASSARHSRVGARSTTALAAKGDEPAAEKVPTGWRATIIRKLGGKVGDEPAPREPGQARSFDQLDLNKDGKVTAEEILAAQKLMDLDGDGVVSREEFEASGALLDAFEGEAYVEEKMSPAAAEPPKAAAADAQPEAPPAMSSAAAGAAPPAPTGVDAGAPPVMMAAVGGVAAIPAAAATQQSSEGFLADLADLWPKPDVADEEVADLFSRYDPDGSGEIDVEEFGQIALEMKADEQRRTVVGTGAALAAGLVVGSYSQEFQLVQALTRGFFAPPAAETAMGAFYPTAKLGNDINSEVARVLSQRGYTRANTLFAHSVCPDEINSKSEELVYLMQNQWGEAFALGGLAGLPFAGKSGFSAFLHHTPDKGKVFIVFAPHVGVDDDGTVGSVLREGQHKHSTACGAAVGAFKALTKAPVVDDGNAVRNVAYDNQLEFILKEMKPLLEGIDNSKDQMAYVSYQTYNIARDLMLSTLNSIPDTYDWCDDLTVLGGLMINRNKGGDFFQPLMLQSKSKDGQVTDLYASAFGPRPDLRPILGSSEKAKQVFSANW